MSSVGGHARLAGCAVVAALASVGAVAQPAAALTTRAADRVAMNALDPSQHPGAVALFALAHPLREGEVIAEGGVEASMPAGPVALPGVRLKAPAFLFWLDEAHGAEFEHPSVLLLIDARSGRQIERRKLLWPPVVDGRPTPFTATEAGYESRRYELYVRAPLLGPVPSASPAHRASTLAPGTFAKDCMITIGDALNPMFAGDFVVMKGWANSVGLSNSYAADAGDLANEVGTDITGGCGDVFIYIAGHGQAAPDYVERFNRQVAPPTNPVPTVELGQRFTFDAKGNTSLTQQTLTLPQLDAVVKAHPATEFKFKIDSCFSGRFAPLHANANVRVLELSSAADQPSQGYLADAITEQGGKKVPWSQVADNPSKATEFTNGDVHGLQGWAASPQQQTAHPGLAGAIEDSLPLGMDKNGSATAMPGTPEFTNPTVTTNSPLPMAPARVTPPTAPGNPVASSTSLTFGAPELADPGQYVAAVIDFVLWGEGADGETVPANGQVTAVTLRGNYIPGSCVAMSDSICENGLHFQDLRPQPNGSLLVVSTTQGFFLPTTLGTYTFDPTNFFLQQGDLLGLATVGGSFNVLAATPGATTNGFQGNNLDMNGSLFSGNLMFPNLALDMQATLQPT